MKSTNIIQICYLILVSMNCDLQCLVRRCSCTQVRCALSMAQRTCVLKHLHNSCSVMKFVFSGWFLAHNADWGHWDNRGTSIQGADFNLSGGCFGTDIMQMYEIVKYQSSRADFRTNLRQNSMRVFSNLKTGGKMTRWLKKTKSM